MGGNTDRSVREPGWPTAVRKRNGGSRLLFHDPEDLSVTMERTWAFPCGDLQTLLTPLITAQGSHRTSQVDIRLLLRFSDSALLGAGPHRLFSPIIQAPILSSGHRALVGTAINHTAINQTAFYQTAQAAGSVSVRQRREGDFYHHQNFLLTQPTLTQPHLHC